jgi:uncharacterized protein YndB with AHSA1/START domain
MSQSEREDVVLKSIVVERGVEPTFRAWTESIHAWWPAGHSRSRDPRTQVIIEGRLGGRFFERSSEGVEYEWGQVVAWEPPFRVAFTWYLGSDAERPTRVVVSFVALGERRTRIELEHRGPEHIGELWPARKGIFSANWDVVLAAFATFRAW